MHICTVLPSYLPVFGGAEVGVHQILSYLAHTTEHRYSVITATTDQSLPQYDVLDGVEVYRYLRSPYWVKWFAPTWSAFRHIGKLLRQLQPDIIHASYILPTGLAAYYAAHRMSIPLMLTLGGIDIYDPFNQPPALLRYWVKHVVKNISPIAVNSHHSQQVLIQEYDVSADQVTVTGFGVDTQRFNDGLSGASIRQRYGLADDTPTIVALQRLEARKGVDILVYAMEKVVKTLPHAHLLIGGKGRHKAQLETLIADLNLQNNVTLCGFIAEEDKPNFYAAGDLFALHSHFEGLGIVIQEASAVGIPVVSTDAGGTHDVVQANTTGYLVPVGDIDTMAQRFLELLTNQNLRTQMGQAAREFTVTTYDIATVARRFLQLFEQCWTQCASRTANESTHN